MNEQDKFNLEEMVDKHGLESVLEALSSICADKADHISANYDDRTLAGAWTASGLAIEEVIGEIKV